MPVLNAIAIQLRLSNRRGTMHCRKDAGLRRDSSTFASAGVEINVLFIYNLKYHRNNNTPSTPEIPRTDFNADFEDTAPNVK